MSVFRNYAFYYDLFYEDKDYVGEVAYVDQLIKQYHPKAQSILDLGCGTGRHDFLLAEKGYTVTGIDSSQDMLIEAHKQHCKLKVSQPAIAQRVSFHEGDIRTVRLNKKFDVVVSLFHVISYQVDNSDLQQVFQTVKRHLCRGHIFIFDFWYGPAVLTEHPVVRIKRLENEKIHATRIAEPVMHARKNVVDVNYEMFVKEKTSGKIDIVQERHRMRYLFEPEIEFFLLHHELEFIDAFEFMTNQTLNYQTWNACVISRKL